MRPENLFPPHIINIKNLRVVANEDFLVSELEESNYDDQLVGGTVLERLQASVGPAGI